MEVLRDGEACRISILRDSLLLTYSAVVDAWQDDAAFRNFFISILERAPFAAYFWETPPVTDRTADRTFEFVFVDSPFLAQTSPNASDFRSYFDAAEPAEDVVEFPNLGHDAFLIAPCPRAHESAYTHLAAFAREAPIDQQHALWRAVGASVARRLDEHPLWLSTAGGGVPWLHVRLDSRPKYYTYDPYRQAS
ncbi:MAG: DUF6940 family protein [Gammaproteobacteria bacterium]